MKNTIIGKEIIGIIILVVLVMLMRNLPSPLNVILCFISLVAFLSYPVIKGYLNDHNKNSKSPKAKKAIKKKSTQSSFDEKNKINTNKNLIAILKLAFMILSVITIIASVSFCVIIGNYKIMSSLCMVLFLIIFILYIKYSNILVIEDTKEQYFKEKINIKYILLIPCISLGLRSIFDFNLLSYTMFIILSIVLFLAIIFVFFIFTNGNQRKRSSICIIVMAALFFAPSAVIQSNYIFDYSEANIVQSTIYDKITSKSSKSGDSFKIVVGTSKNKRIEIRVPKEYYEKHAMGDKVNVFEKQGFLNIPYIYVKTKS